MTRSIGRAFRRASWKPIEVGGIEDDDGAPSSRPAASNSEDRAAHLVWVVGPFETDAGAAANRQQGLPEQLLFAIPGGLVASHGVVVRMRRQFRT